MVLRAPKCFKNKGGQEGHCRGEGAHHAGLAGATLTAQVLLGKYFGVGRPKILQTCGN